VGHGVGEALAADQQEENQSSEAITQQAINHRKGAA
jgi:hypothetical protein